ncbi:MAG: hypothetical protein KAY37_14760, partial [Phycisphaerae bacterium]|nr:hypothetical protein [Phycisphaerae bacterium]
MRLANQIGVTTLGLCMLLGPAVQSAPAQEAAGWNFWVVDPALGDGGRSVSMSVNDVTGHVAVCYFYVVEAANVHELRFADFDGVAWTAPVSLAVDATTDVYVSMTSFHNAGNDVAVSYFNGSGLYYFERVNNAWAGPLPVDTTAVRGAFNSIDIMPSGKPMISYLDQTNANLRVAWYEGGAWQLHDVDTANAEGDTSLAMINDGAGDYPAISYRGTGGALKFAWNPGTDYSTGWATKTVLGSPVEHTSLAPIPPVPPAVTWERPMMSYYDTAGDLWYAWNAGQMGNWGSTAYWKQRRAAVNAGQYDSLAFRITDNPIISYYDAAAGLKVATSTNPYALSPTWTNLTVDAPQPLGQGTSLAVLADGAAAICYYANSTLKFALQKHEACCFPDGSCTEEIPAECDELGGIAQGENTTCDPNPCPQPGACCETDGACNVMQEVDCTGTWMGEGTICEADTCLGACCQIDGSCAVTTQDGCNNIFVGFGYTCAPLDPCSTMTGACCIGGIGGVCEMWNEFYCTVIYGGTYIGDGVSCSPDPCSTVTGACCIAGACTQQTEYNCVVINGGTYLGDGFPCTPNPCPGAPTGACCPGDTTCIEVSEYNCLKAGGTYLGDGTTCTPNPCPDAPSGACCIEGVCSVTTELDCVVNNGGTYIGDGTDCGPPDPCSETTGACCPGDTTCIELNEYFCLASGGTYMGDGTNCEPNPCPDAPTGACCIVGVCSVTTEYDCVVTNGGTYIGDDIGCTPDPCSTTTGACCINDVCSVTTEFDCVVNNGGTYIGDGTDCGPPDPCSATTGACCIGTTCSVLNEYYCLDAGGTYIGDGTDCGPP